MEDFFKNCGFDDKESGILAYLAKATASTAGAISKSLKIKRPTVYSILDRLSHSGYINSWKERGITHYRISDRETLPKQIEIAARNNFERTLNNTGSLARELLKLAKANQQNKFGEFKIRSIDTMSGILNDLQSLLTSGETCGIFNPELALKDEGKEIVKGYIQWSNTAKPKIRELTVPSKSAAAYRAMIKNPNHQVKDLPKGYNIETDMILSLNTISFYHYYNRSWSAIKIEQKELYRSFMGIFDLLWDLN